MATKRKTRRAKGVQYPSETYAARAKRGRYNVTIVLSEEAKERLDTLAAVAEETKSAVVEGLILGTKKKV